MIKGGRADAGWRRVGPSAPLAVDAVGYRTLVDSDASIEAKFPAEMRVLRWGQS